jgi:hypothetical protein
MECLYNLTERLDRDQSEARSTGDPSPQASFFLTTNRIAF